VTIGVGNALALKEHKTTVKKKTLNPTWNETFDLMVPENQPYLVFTVFDEDLLSASPAPRRDGRDGPEGEFCLMPSAGWRKDLSIWAGFLPRPSSPRRQGRLPGPGGVRLPGGRPPERDLHAPPHAPR